MSQSISKAALREQRALLKARRKAPVVAKGDGHSRAWSRGQTAAVGTATQTFGKRDHFLHDTGFVAHQATMNFAVKARVAAGAVALCKREAPGPMDNYPIGQNNADLPEQVTFDAEGRKSEK